jgi:hypothetical protein
MINLVELVEEVDDKKNKNKNRKPVNKNYN